MAATVRYAPTRCRRRRTITAAASCAASTSSRRSAGVALAAIDGVVHATTVATNTILEMKGAKTALVTTAGFRDVLEMRRLRIPVLYDLQYDKPPPLAPRRLRFEVTERIGARGDVRVELDEAGVAAVAERIAAAEVDAVAICFLHSYANPAHERRVAGILRARLGPDVYVTCSADILPEIREYERTSTTVVNAYIGPVVARYLRRSAAASPSSGSARRCA
jgi:N-methylhydantoinase A